MLLALAVFSLIVFVGVLLFLFDGFFGGLDFTSNRKTLLEVISVLKKKRLESGSLIDLGSGKGGFALKLARGLPQIKILGIDDNNFRIKYSKARAIFLNNIEFLKEDIFKTNVSKAHAVYIYLPKELMPELEAKLKAELKPGAVVLTNKVSFPNWQPTEKINNLFIYVKE